VFGKEFEFFKKKRGGTPFPVTLEKGGGVSPVSGGNKGRGTKKLFQEENQSQKRPQRNTFWT